MDENQFQEGEMTIPEFRKYLINKYTVTSEGKEISLNYAHVICGYGRMPKTWGGNILEVRKIRGVKVVKISEKLFDFNSGNRKKRDI